MKWIVLLSLFSLSCGMEAIECDSGWKSIAGLKVCSNGLNISLSEIDTLVDVLEEDVSSRFPDITGLKETFEALKTEML